MDPPAPDAPRSGVAPPARRTLRWPVRIGVALAAILGATVLYEALTWPDVAALAEENPTTSSFIDRYWSRQPAPRRPEGARIRWTSYGSISPHLKRAVLVSEDINFFSHDGFDVGEIRNAIDEAIERKEAPRGASTITQQLAKNLWLSPSRDPLRKLKEAILTRQLEESLGKRRILELYLNVAQFGPGVFGVGDASRVYFEKAPGDLGESEAAQLAAALPRPSAWHPGSESRAFARRVERILRRMDRAGFLWKVI